MTGPIAPRIVVLTGAGVSAESGVPTFRDADGLWEGHRVEDVATPQAFSRDPDIVQGFYDLRRKALDVVAPNPAHEALARLQREHAGPVDLVTQNIDDLLERAGCTDVIHMHGRLRTAWCTTCGERCDSPARLLDDPPCPQCGALTLRPDVVWFGEIPYEMERIEAALAGADLFVSVGTSGAVYPAAGFVQVATAYGARTLELNLEPSHGSGFFDEARHGPASDLVPAWVAQVLSSTR